MPAQETLISVEEVQFNSKVASVIRSFIEYANECNYHGRYPESSIIVFHSMRHDVLFSDTIKRPVLDCYPIGDYYPIGDVKYVSEVHIDSTCYRIYLQIDDTWCISDMSDFFIYTGIKKCIPQHTIESYDYEYDPPFVRLWYVYNQNRESNGFYIEWGTSNYCW